MCSAHGWWICSASVVSVCDYKGTCKGGVCLCLNPFSVFLFFYCFVKGYISALSFVCLCCVVFCVGCDSDRICLSFVSVGV